MWWIFGASSKERASPSGEIRSRQLLILAEKKSNTPTFEYQVDKVLKYAYATSRCHLVGFPVILFSPFSTLPALLFCPLSNINLFQILVFLPPRSLLPFRVAAMLDILTHVGTIHRSELSGIIQNRAPFLWIQMLSSVDLLYSTYTCLMDMAPEMPFMVYCVC